LTTNFSADCTLEVQGKGTPQQENVPGDDAKQENEEEME
jgi:hypothetical protein